MSQHPSTASTQRQIQAIEDRIREQEARLSAMIVRGTPTQAAEDDLRKLYATLRDMKALHPSHPDARTLHRGLLNRAPRSLHGDKPRG